MSGVTTQVTGPIRILVAEDHHVVRQGLVALLKTISGFEVVAEAADGRQAIDRFEEYRPDITLMDLRMPNLGGVEAVTQIRSKYPNARVIVLTTFDGDEDIYRAIQAGAKGYFLKGVFGEELVDAIRAVHAGKTRIPSAVAERLADRMGGPGLTNRELDVLKGIVAGRSNKEIGLDLSISEATVKTHINSILGKLGVSDRTQAATTALQRGIVHFPS
jgi:DNA-binding NarL/FixJ family response regulator